MRRKWLVVGGVAIILLLLVLLTVTLFNRSAKTTACQQIVQSIVDYDADASYGLFSPTLQEELSQEAWREKVRGLYILFAGTTEITLNKRSETVDPAFQKRVIREEYTAKSETGSLNPTCFLNDSGQVTGFVEN